MPVYEFKCNACGKVETRLQVSYQPVAPRCECGPWMTLQLVASTVVYKGAGWAKKDRKDGGKQ
jgi:putative FmdB family regulatory protein